MKQVTLKQFDLSCILNLELKIPDYQREYCWGDKQVETLLEGLSDYFCNPKTSYRYRMGTVILQNKGNEEFNVIDGQQRLTTLALLIYQISLINNNKVRISILDRQVTTNEQKAVSNSLFLINRFLSKKIIKSQINDIFNSLMNNVEFSVLTLSSETSLDLAFTFFSNTNSRGKSLSDYDLLKAHHLRFFDENEENKANFLATRWDELIDPYNNEENVPIYKRVLDLYIFRLRHYLDGNAPTNELQRIYEEYRASPIIEELAPFGETFHYGESIQGGAYFFNYANIMIEHGRNFKKIFEVKKLYSNFSSSRQSHSWFAELTAAHLFAYYLKFGEQFLPEAMMLILRKVSQLRIESNTRVYYSSLLEASFNNHICRLIERATSPTFFLADLKIEIEKLDFPHSENTETDNNLAVSKFKYVISDGNICTLRDTKEKKGKVTADYISRYLNLLKELSSSFRIDSIKIAVGFDYLKE